MPLQLPNLDDRRYSDLVAEARRLIPGYDPDWTNHNPSDPGITLIELFAYLTEMLIYRLDRVTTENQRKFLKLLNGPDWTPGPDLSADIRDSVLAIRTRERAVTAADFEQLATENFNQWLVATQRAEQEGEALDEWWRVTQLDPADPLNLPSNLPSVARAACVVSRNLERGTEAERTSHAAAHVSLIVLPQDSGMLQPPLPQKAALWGYLDERRTLTTRHHVVGPYYAPIGGEMVIATTGGALTEAVGRRVMEELDDFLSPLTGGTAKSGWPFGRDVYVSELYERIEAIEGVDYIVDLMLVSECLPTDQQCSTAPPLWHAEGDLVGMELGQHQLPFARFSAPDLAIASSTSFLPARVAVTLTKTSEADPIALKRQAKTVVREFFHPLHLGPAPDGTSAKDLLLTVLRSGLEAIDGVTAVGLGLQAEATRLLEQNGEIIGLHVEAGELVSWETQVVVQQS